MMMMECTICCELLSSPAEDRCVHQLRYNGPLRLRQRTAFMRSCSLSDLSFAPCGHQFHTRCLQNWLLSTENPTCPNCRAKTSFQQIRQISQSSDDSDMSPESESLNGKGRGKPRIDKYAEFVRHRNPPPPPPRSPHGPRRHRQHHSWSPMLDIMLASLRAHVHSVTSGASDNN